MTDESPYQKVNLSFSSRRLSSPKAGDSPEPEFYDFLVNGCKVGKDVFSLVRSESYIDAKSSDAAGSDGKHSYNIVYESGFISAFKLYQLLYLSPNLTDSRESPPTIAVIRLVASNSPVDFVNTDDKSQGNLTYPL
jgi:hypothetical protein